MKRPTFPVHGFTLIELLIVISIIMVLSGMTMSLFSFANFKAASDRTRAEISALSLALESYKIDNGDYPRDTSTDALDAQVSPLLAIQNGAVPPAGAASLVLYKELSGDADLNGMPDIDPITKAKNHVYFEFKQGLLYPKAASGVTRAAGSIKALVDPFRNVYGYSTIGSMTTGTSTATTKGYNPTFDLWSTADSKQTGTTEPTWIKNW